MEYNWSSIEKKWQEIWQQENAFAAKPDKTMPKFFALIEFPYPSGDGLHVGHPRSNTALDVISRKRRLEGYNVLYPIGWDAFGLPTENYAIKNKIHPSVVTEKNVSRFRSQLKALGFSFDWSREINTTSPEYYKWTQWIFLQMFKSGLAYKAEIPINWCTDCKVGLANEEVVNGGCERCGGEVVKKVKSQWMLKITEYAQRLIDDLDTVQYIEKVKMQQRNWIGRSEGAEVDFKIVSDNDRQSGQDCPVDCQCGQGCDCKVTVFTTRPDTLFGATYMVVSPEHPLIEQNKAYIKNFEQVEQYKKEALKKSDFERTELVKEKTGVMLEGVHAVNPVNQKFIPVWVSDYVLMTYGTGAIMAVPAHDSRDWEFAKKFNMPIIEVVSGGQVDEQAFTNIDDGIMTNSGFLDGKKVSDAITAITDWLTEQGLGKRKINYKLRDWVFSRQRYWGEPIPIVCCDKCGYVPVPDNQLPLLLPEVDNYLPSSDGESPLSAITSWVNTTCPQCGGAAKRETDTMPNWAGSSWYFLRYADPHNNEVFAAKEQLDYWLPVDWYNGGMEHTTLHLLYSRFWHKFLYDQGYVSTSEPYMKRTSHGMILGENNEKMSKSRGNVVNPDEIVSEFGADSFRVYEMFIGAFDQAIPWSQAGVRGCRRFLDRVWRLTEFLSDDMNYSPELELSMHKTIKKVTQDIERMKFNTAISAMMSLVNEFYDRSHITKGEFKTLLILLNPFAPHITEELWQMTGFEQRIYLSKWCEWDEAKTVEDMVDVAVQINGKLRTLVKIANGAVQQQAKEVVMANPVVQKQLEGKTIKKEIYVPSKIYNIVV